MREADAARSHGALTAAVCAAEIPQSLLFCSGTVSVPSLSTAWERAAQTSTSQAPSVSSPCRPSELVVNFWSLHQGVEQLMQGGLLHLLQKKPKISIKKAQETALQNPRHAACGLGTTQGPLSCYLGGRVPSAAAQIRNPLRPCGAVPRPRGGRRCFGPGGGAVVPRSGRALSRAEPSETEWDRTEPSRAERSRAGRTASPCPECEGAKGC